MKSIYVNSTIINKSTVNWREVDKQLTTKVIEAAKRIYELNPPKPIKKGTIIGVMDPFDENRITNNKEKLPLTILKLEELVEKQDEYLIRSIPRMISRLEKKGLINISIKSFISDKPIYKNCSESVTKKIEEVLYDSGY